MNIDNISQLPSLTTVDLSLNQIVDLRPLLALNSLTDLNLHSNLMYAGRLSPVCVDECVGK